MTRILMACVAAMALGACGGSDGGDTDDGHEASAQYAGPIGSSDTAHGEEVFNSVCSSCHSSGPALENIAWEAARVREQVREGSGRMPPISENRVSADDLEAILAYMVTTGGVTGDAGATDTGGGEEEPPMDDGAGEEEPPAEEAAATDA